MARVTQIDPESGSTVVRLAPGRQLNVFVDVTPAVPRDVDVVLRIISGPGGPSYPIEIPGVVKGSCRSRVEFSYRVLSGFPDGVYELEIPGFENGSFSLTLALGGSPSSVSSDPCAITLSPTIGRVAATRGEQPASFPLPPLLTVSSDGCERSAWDANARGWLLVPSGTRAVDVRLAACPETTVFSLELPRGVRGTVRDARFWGDRIAVLTPGAVTVYDSNGCVVMGPDTGPITPFPPSGLSSIGNGVGLASTDSGDLLVVQRRPSRVRRFRRDGSELASPAAFEGRGWYAKHRNRAFVHGAETCAYRLEPGEAGSGCCVEPSRALTDDESLFFRLIDDQPWLRQRRRYPRSGSVIIGPGAEQDPLDAGRPGTQWHRVRVRGDIPPGAVVRIETRANDDLLAGDPLVADGWSRAVDASANSRVPAESPDDTSELAADALVLAPPGRFLWMRLTLLGDGTVSPRIDGIEVEQPRAGIARYLPAVFQNSTPDDDFLRRWLALFETTAFDGVGELVRGYGELFDPRFAPASMLSYLAGWLEILETPRLRDDETAFRRALVAGPELARTRGTIDGLALAVWVYTGTRIQIVESTPVRASFVLADVDDPKQGALLGGSTVLSAERPPVTLGDQPRLGTGYLLGEDDRAGYVPHRFEVLVPASAVCTSEALALLHEVLELEKPAHTEYRLRRVGRAGFVLGIESLLGQQTREGFDRADPDPPSYGIAVLNGPPRPAPLGDGFVLGHDSRLPGTGLPGMVLEPPGLTVGRTTRVRG